MSAHLRKMSLVFVLWVMLPGIAQAGWYAGAGVGNAESAMAVAFDFPPSTESDDSGLAWTLVGGYEFAPNMAIEFGYGDLGDSFEAFNVLGDDERIQLDVAEWEVALIGKIAIHDKARLFGRLGVTLWDVELSYSEPGFASSDCDRDLDAIIGMGFEWQVWKTVGVRFEWKQYQNIGDEVKTDMPPATGERLELNGSDINVLGVAATFRFGD